MATTDEANALLRHENDALRAQLNEAGDKWDAEGREIDLRESGPWNAQRMLQQNRRLR